MRPIFVICVALAGCSVGVAVPVGRAHPLSRAAAVDVAVHYAAAHGYANVALKEAERDDGLWKIELRVAPPYRGQLDVAVDPWTAEVIRFREDVKRGRHRKDDDDDD